jgi:hypothetical protein
MTVILNFLVTLKINNSQVLVAHACNPSYSGGRDHKDPGSKPAWANSSRDPILKKNPSQEKNWWSGLKCRPQVQSPVPQGENNIKIVGMVSHTSLSR